MSVVSVAEPLERLVGEPQTGARASKRAAWSRPSTRRRARCRLSAGSISRCPPARPLRCWGRTARASRRPSTCCSGSPARRRHGHGVRRNARTRPCAAGSVGAMLQTGELIRDLSVRELLVHVASLYPQRGGRRRALELTGIPDREPADAEALGWAAPARPLRAGPAHDAELLVLDEPTVGMDVESRHAFWTTMRPLASRGRPSSLPRTTSRRRTSSPTASCSWRTARSSPTGPRTRSRRRSACGGSARRSPMCRMPSSRSCRASARSSGAARASFSLLRLRRRDPRAPRAYPEARDIEIGGGSLEEAFLELTADANLKATADASL